MASILIVPRNASLFGVSGSLMQGILVSVGGEQPTNEAETQVHIQPIHPTRMRSGQSSRVLAHKSLHTAMMHDQGSLLIEDQDQDQDH